jgi:hypothetical protein
VSERVNTPWTPAQIAGLQAWQDAGYVHEFTCVTNHSKGSRVLIPTREGWRCPSCHYRQRWAPDFAMTGPPPNPLTEMRP